MSLRVQSPLDQSPQKAEDIMIVALPMSTWQALAERAAQKGITVAVLLGEAVSLVCEDR